MSTIEFLMEQYRESRDEISPPYVQENFTAPLARLKYREMLLYVSFTSFGIRHLVLFLFSF